ncbi:mycothiol transferase, partial [Nocardia farcinica]|uniref:mycothiol transferase n=1 Tax=Nocardia farcinica TaxID=37329 RepID=UPI00379C3E2A
MTWTAPEVTRTSAPTAAGERELLQGWLDRHRRTLLWKCAGLDTAALRRRAVPPSRMSLLGLVRHMSEVERGWFR